MPETPQPRRTAAALALGLTAAVVIVAYLMAPDGDADRRRLVVNLIYGVAWLMGGVVLLAMREGKVARSSRAVGITFVIGSVVISLVFVSGITGSGVEPGYADLLFLLPLVTLIRRVPERDQASRPTRRPPRAGDRCRTDRQRPDGGGLRADQADVRNLRRLRLGGDLRAGRRVPRRDVSRPGDLDPHPCPCRARGGVRGTRRRRP